MGNKIGAELLQAKIDVQEYQLALLREEIDDNISQMLSSIKIILGITGKNLLPISDAIRTTQEVLTTAIRYLNLISNSIKTGWLDRFNLIESIGAEVNRINHWQKAKICLFVSTASLPVDHQIQLVLFAIMIEALKNCLEHSKAKRIFIEINYDNRLQITMEDDGISFKKRPDMNSSVKKAAGYIKLIGGNIIWSSAQSKERKIWIQLP